MILHNLFPTPVAKFELGRDFTAEENAFAASQSTRKNMGNTTSDDPYVLRHDTLANLMSFVQLSVDTYLKSIYAPRNAIMV